MKKNTIKNDKPVEIQRYKDFIIEKYSDSRFMFKYNGKLRGIATKAHHFYKLIFDIEGEKREISKDDFVIEILKGN